jgi:ppGpp synthetase/RelA/SpoT-type nucleotidyltranferase
MPRPFSSSEIERLGVRLTQKQGSPDPADLEQLLELLSAYSVALDGATERVREAIGFAPSARVKNTGTILEKLDRYGGSWLKSIHDLAGMRVVRSQTRAEQDALTEKILAVFAGESKAPKVIDRRAEPVQGYRAVHVVVYPDGFPIEIQIRTQMQHEWAEIFEKLADVLGRGIRYGEPVRNGVVDRAVKVGDALDELEAAGELDAEARAARAFLKEASEMLTALPQTVIAVADVIDMIERAERDKPPPWSDSEVVAAWLRVRQTLDKVQDAIDRIPSSSLPDFSAED